MFFKDLRKLCESKSIILNKEGRNYRLKSEITEDTHITNNLWDAYDIYNNISSRHNNKTYFKITNRGSSYSETYYDVEYKVGKVTYPKLVDSKLFVFSDMSYLTDFVGCMDESAEILLCKVVNPTKSKLMGFGGCQDFWYRYAVNQKELIDNPLSTYPADGTVFCDAVIPYYKLTYSEFVSVSCGDIPKSVQKRIVQ